MSLSGSVEEVASKVACSGTSPVRVLLVAAGIVFIMATGDEDGAITLTF